MEILPLSLFSTVCVAAENKQSIMHALWEAVLNEKKGLDFWLMRIIPWSLLHKSLKIMFYFIYDYTYIFWKRNLKWLIIF